MTERGLLTQLLLQSLFDYIPDPHSSMFESEFGVRESKWAPCQVCGSRGRTAWQHSVRMPCPRCIPLRHGRAAPTAHGCDMCPGCDGFGYRRSTKADEPWDEYTDEQLSGPTGRPRQKTLDELDSQYNRLETARRQREGEPLRFSSMDIRLNQHLIDALGDDLDIELSLRFLAQLEMSKSFQWRQGSYNQLVEQLDWLHGLRPDWYSLLWQHEVMHVQMKLSANKQLLIDLAIEGIAQRMPTPIRVPDWLLDKSAQKTSLARGRTQRHDQARGIRNEEIRQLYAAAWKKSRIARHYGLTERHVNRILAA